MEELPFEADGKLPIQNDPKLIWAYRNLVEKPIEINLADRHTLLRVPGIGPKGADNILRVRGLTKIRDMTILKKLGILTERAAPFLLLNGSRAAYQPVLLQT